MAGKRRTKDSADVLHEKLMRFIEEGCGVAKYILVVRDPDSDMTLNMGCGDPLWRIGAARASAAEWEREWAGCQVPPPPRTHADGGEAAGEDGEGR